MGRPQFSLEEAGKWAKENGEIRGEEWSVGRGREEEESSGRRRSGVGGGSWGRRRGAVQAKESKVPYLVCAEGRESVKFQDSGTRAAGEGRWQLGRS